ncbi:MAG: hypothetical protein ACOVQM_02515, partial [Pirellula sp.]
LRKTLDPDGSHPLLDNMVLVGHSMGGLVSRMQTIESGEEFWRILSDEPYEKVRGDDEERQRLAAALFFHPNNAIKRVVTIGTPHRGSDYANDYTRWIGRNVITLPSSITDMGNSLIRQNPGLFRNTELLTTTTSIDSLSPESPIFPTMLRARRAPWVNYHNIIGIMEKSNWFGKDATDSDGIVNVESAHMDDVDSEILVQSRHQDIHRTARAVLEVRRILVEHLRKSAQQPALAGLLTLPNAWTNQAYSEPMNPGINIASTQQTGIAQTPGHNVDKEGKAGYNTSQYLFPNVQETNRPAPIVRLVQP